MPSFVCPKCGKQYFVPLAICESFLDDTSMITPDGSEASMIVLPCPDCTPHLDCTKQNLHVIEGEQG